MNNQTDKKPDNTRLFNNFLKQMNNNQNSSQNASFSNFPNDLKKNNNFTKNSDFDSIFESIKNSSFSNSSNIENEKFNNRIDNSKNGNNNNNSNPFSNLDMETIFKLKSIIDKMNNSTNDPRSNLLLSLKPYLKDSRKEKIDQYIKIFTMTQIFQNLNNGGEK